MTNAPPGSTLQRLAEAAEQARAAEADVRALAVRAAAEGASYGDLGRAIGITRQGARKRFPGVLAARTPVPPTTTEVPGGTDPEAATGRARSDATPTRPDARPATTKVPVDDGHPAIGRSVPEPEPAPGGATTGTAPTRRAVTASRGATAPWPGTAR